MITSRPLRYFFLSSDFPFDYTSLYDNIDLLPSVTNWPQLSLALKPPSLLLLTKLHTRSSSSLVFSLSLAKFALYSIPRSFLFDGGFLAQNLPWKSFASLLAQPYGMSLTRILDPAELSWRVFDTLFSDL